MYRTGHQQGVWFPPHQPPGHVGHHAVDVQDLPPNREGQVGEPPKQQVGHRGTASTQTVYRKQIGPVITEGAEVMDQHPPGKPQPGERNARAADSSWPKVITISLPLA